MKTKLITAVVVALSALAIGAAGAQADTINWDSFAQPSGYGPSLTDGDKITLRTERYVGVPYDKIEVRLQTMTTWRKGIEFDRKARACYWWGGCYTTDEFMSGIYLQDSDHGPTSRLISVSDAKNPLGYGRLRFGKAKAFGIYSNNVHTLNWDAAHVVGGTRYTFNWITD